MKVGPFQKSALSDWSFIILSLVLWVEYWAFFWCCGGEWADRLGTATALFGIVLGVAVVMAALHFREPVYKWFRKYAGETEAMLFEHWVTIFCGGAFLATAVVMPFSLVVSRGVCAENLSWSYFATNNEFVRAALIGITIASVLGVIAGFLVYPTNIPETVEGLKLLYKITRDILVAMLATWTATMLGVGIEYFRRIQENSASIPTKRELLLIMTILMVVAAVPVRLLGARLAYILRLIDVIQLPKLTRAKRRAKTDTAASAGTASG